ncbi:probable amidase At4g34880 [Nymphaea colorata]|nr:probable amidase At4g34880 [Nymphaea colorata]
MSNPFPPFLSVTRLIFLFLLSLFPTYINGIHSTAKFEFREATIEKIRSAFERQELTSRQLVEYYLDAIDKLNPRLRAVIEVNPEALALADKADEERGQRGRAGSTLHGIPVLLKDSIGTKDSLNTTAGSLALVGSAVRRDAGVARRLRRSGAIILGKASMSEWYGVRSRFAPQGWNARVGQPMNPYVATASPCGSSTGSAIGVAANMVAVSLGTETHGSIICPADKNSVVGIKPTVGLTSRAGVVPLSPRQDTIGPICRTVADAVYVLEEIVGYDARDKEATEKAAKFIPVGGYRQFLRNDGLRGKRLGIVPQPFFNFSDQPSVAKIFEDHLHTMRRHGAILVDNLVISNISTIRNWSKSGESTALLYEFRQNLNSYLKGLKSSSVRSLADVIAFNERHPIQEKMKEYGQDVFLASESSGGLAEEVKVAVKTMEELSKNGFEKLMKHNKLDALVTPSNSASNILAIGGYPAISVPAGYYGKEGVPIGICFGGLRGSEPTLIEIAYSYEQATKIRKPPKIQV